MAADRLSALEQCFLELQADGAHMDIGWTIICEGSPPSLDQLRARVADRLVQAPRFRTRVLSSRLQLHDPVWSEDPSFAIDNHVNDAHARRPSASSLRRVAGQLLSVPLPEHRPLWRLHRITGLGAKRFALVGQAHHALVDGIAAPGAARLVIDRIPDDVREDAPAGSGCPAAPGMRERMLATMAARMKLAESVGSFSARALVNAAYRRECAQELRRLGSALSAIGTAAPRTSINRPISDRRSLAFADLPRPILDELARRYRATAGDVILATAALALGSHLRRAGESHPWLRVLIPAQPPAAIPVGDAALQRSAMFMELPVGERDPRAAVAEVTRQRREQERALQANAIDRLLGVCNDAPPPLRRSISWLMRRPQTFNAMVAAESTGRGSAHVLGRRIRAIYPTLPLVQGHGLSVAILSYRECAHLGLCADPQVVPELTDLGHDFTRAFDLMRLSLSPPPDPIPKPTVSRFRRRSELLA